jgi:IS605 OrfB family transposase
MLTFEFDTPSMRRCSSILAVDLGERFAASAVLMQNGTVMKAKFFGKEIRGVRRHYAWLRKRLQERGLTQVVKRIGKKEKRVVNAILHRVSKGIVSLADSADSYIVLGDLTGIRRRVKGKGKRFNRIVSNMPFYRLTKMIEYKAMLKGIPVITTSEAYTSKTCHVCGCEGNRKSQGLFVCSHCGEYNADLNGAVNIGKKFERDLGYMPLSGVVCEPALNHAESMEAPPFKVG